MELEIRHPKIKELDEAIELIYIAFRDAFDFLFEKDFEFGKRLFVNFYKKTVKKQDLKNFVIAKSNNKIVATANLDFDNPHFFHLLKFVFYFLKLNLHFLRARDILGIRRTIRITIAMYWFFFETFRRNSCYINLFAVAPEFHRRGIGTRMLREIEKITRKRRLGSMSLDVAFLDFPARHLYEKVGFIEVRRFHHSVLKRINGIEGVFSMKKPLKY